MTAPALPALGPGDVYLYSHGNGAIYVGYADGRSLLAPLGEAVAIAQGCHAAGSRVVVAWDHTPIAVDAVDRVRAAGVPVIEFSASVAPHAWGEGTDALIEAAALGTDALLDDLIARGADLHHTDDSGSTALHHAAANGSLHAIDVLVAAGADSEQRNLQGFTPQMLAVACREQEAAARLVELGADPGTTTPTVGAPIRFGRSHFGPVYVWLVPILFVVFAAIGFWPLTPLGWLGLVAFAVGVAIVVPPRPFWAGGVPRRLDGTVLTVRSPFGRVRTVDLAAVTVAASGGSTSRSGRLAARWLVLGHPDGAPVSRRSLRRLLLPPGDLEALTSRMDRAVVLPLDGGHAAEVIRPIGNLLSSRGVDLSGSLRQQLARARRA